MPPSKKSKTDKVPKILQSEIRMRDRAPKSKTELQYYLRHFYHIYLASNVIEEGNSTPLDFVWDVYSTALGLTANPHYNVLGLASRGGQKTLSTASIEALLMQHDKRNLIHMAATKEQASVGYEHYNKVFLQPIMSDVVDQPITKSMSRSTQNNSILLMATATMESVNAKHASILIQDELDLTPKKIFDESQGMLSSELNNMPINICISSRKYAIGNVQSILDNATKNNELWAIHKWGILEFTQKCHPERHGEYGTEIWVDEENLVAISESEYLMLDSANLRDKYVKLTGYKNCLGCGIFSFCKGGLVKQCDDNPWLQPIEQTVTIFRKESDSEFFKSQRLCRKPSKKGLIYPMWDESIHVKTYAQMWEIFTGEVHPDIKALPAIRQRSANIPLETLIQEFLRHGCRCVLGVDFGFSVLAVAGLFFIDGSDRVYFVDELSATGLSDAEFASEIWKRWSHLPIDMVYADPESPGGKKEIRKATQWPVSERVDKRIDDGLSTVRRFMRIPGTRKTALLVATNCTVFREEVPQYHNKIDPRTGEPLDDVVKKDDHSCDQARYVLHSVYGNSSVNLGFAGEPMGAPNTPKTVEESPDPTALDLLRQTGIKFTDNRESFGIDIGGKKNNGEGGTGGGGFSVSW